jgi:hypothetical protein
MQLHLIVFDYLPFQLSIRPAVVEPICPHFCSMCIYAMPPALGTVSLIVFLILHGIAVSH